MGRSEAPARPVADPGIHSSDGQARGGRAHPGSHPALILPAVTAETETRRTKKERGSGADPAPGLLRLPEGPGGGHSSGLKAKSPGGCGEGAEVDNLVTR